MNVTVMMASGDEDTWEDVTDTVTDAGSLVVLDVPDEATSDDQGRLLSEVKTLVIVQEVLPDDQSLPPTKETRELVVLAQYAPGMWMKVEYS